MYFGVCVCVCVCVCLCACMCAYVRILCMCVCERERMACFVYLEYLYRMHMYMVLCVLYWPRYTVDLVQKVERAGVSWITVHGRTTQQRTEPVSLDAIKLVCSECNVRSCAICSYLEKHYFWGTVLILEGQSLFWRDNSFLEEQSLFWRDSSFLEGQFLFWRESPYFRGTVLIQLLCPSLWWLSSTFYGKKIY